MHENHRERMKQRFLREGLDGFAPHEVLEFLLYFAIPQKDTNETAHLLLERFGSLSAVLDADISELTEVKGVGDHAATLLKLMPSLARRYISDDNSESEAFDNINKIGKYLIKKYVGCPVETVYLLLFDNKYHMIDCVKVFEGSVNSAQITVRRLAETALYKRSAMAVLAHNHPGGVPIPSSDDLHTTQTILAAFDALDITLLEHIIVAGDRFTPLLYVPSDSMRANNRRVSSAFYQGVIPDDFNNYDESTLDFESED